MRVDLEPHVVLRVLIPEGTDDYLVGCHLNEINCTFPNWVRPKHLLLCCCQWVHHGNTRVNGKRVNVIFSLACGAIGFTLRPYSIGKGFPSWKSETCNIPFAKFLQTSIEFLSACLSDLGMCSLRHPFTIPFLSNGSIGDFLRAGGLQGEAGVREADMGAGGQEGEIRKLELCRPHQKKVQARPDLGKACGLDCLYYCVEVLGQLWKERGAIYIYIYIYIYYLVGQIFSRRNGKRFYKYEQRQMSKGPHLSPRFIQGWRIHPNRPRVTYNFICIPLRGAGGKTLTIVQIKVARREERRMGQIIGQCPKVWFLVRKQTSSTQRKIHIISLASDVSLWLGILSRWIVWIKIPHINGSYLCIIDTSHYESWDFWGKLEKSFIKAWGRHGAQQNFSQHKHYDLVTPSQGFPQLGDYLQPPHLCTFHMTVLKTTLTWGCFDCLGLNMERICDQKLQGKIRPPRKLWNILNFHNVKIHFANWGMYKGVEAEDNPPVGETPGESWRGLQDHKIIPL
ncbi:hypothetical protein VP01_2281g3 [Puccinia sorghi]|uniref:Uncharacterized protein n=1 Tax=Puccinia sorghi TaxID=27349 RepID=A0A0L6V814_9BASI|nr:hypothetical protein VP01_2281g3 [Puccinia sorghi]